MTCASNHEFEEALLREATAGIDASPMSEGAADQYPLISGDEIVASDGYYPLRGLLQRMANEELMRGRLQAEGEITRERQAHEAGWTLVIETDKGFVSLWSCWLGNQFYLQYAGEWIPKELIKETLQVTDGNAVKQERPTFLGGGFEMRKWADLYGPVLPDGGRVWIALEERESGGTPAIIDENGEYQRLYQHPDGAMEHSVGNYPFSSFNENEPDAPNATNNAVQEYRERFILLATQAAFRLGTPEAVHTEFALMVMTPEDLEREGYETTWIKGSSGFRYGWGKELVIGSNGKEQIALRSANSVVPWVNLRKINVDQTIDTPYKLAQSILDDHLYF